MKTVGAILREKRLRKGITLSQVEKDIKIRERFLQAIEEDNFTELPSISYAKGFVRNYAMYLALPQEEIMAFFRRQIAEQPKSALLPKGLASPLNTNGMVLTPGKFIGAIISVCVVLFLVYFGVQYRTISLSPALSIIEPKNQAISNQKRISIRGNTDSDATIMINGVSVIVQDNGEFYDQVTLDTGVNTITVVSTSRFGKMTTKKIEVGYQP